MTEQPLWTREQIDDARRAMTTCRRCGAAHYFDGCPWCPRRVPYRNLVLSALVSLTVNTLLAVGLSVWLGSPWLLHVVVGALCTAGVVELVHRGGLERWTR